MTDPPAARQPELVDLDAAERVINRPHIIQLRDDGFTVMHPPACHPRLFNCPVSRAATRDLKGAPKPSEMGEFFCDLRPNGRFRIGERAPDSEGVDWVALVGELRVAREVVEAAWIWREAETVEDQAQAEAILLAKLLAYDQTTGAAP